MIYRTDTLVSETKPVEIDDTGTFLARFQNGGESERDEGSSCVSQEEI